MKRGLFITLGVVGLAAAAVAQPLREAPQDPLAGARVFGVKGCVRCHSVNGVGGTTGPDLARAARPRSFHDLGAALWNHAPRMADRMRSLGIARPRLDPQEAGDLVAFLFAARYFEPPGSREAGRRVFAEKRCVSCHQVAGIGGVVGPALDRFSGSATPIALAAAMWNHAGPMATTMRAGAFPRPTLTASNLRDVMAYVDGTAPVSGDTPVYALPGNAERGRVLFTDKRCAECHAAAGGRGGSAPDLADRHRTAGAIEFAAAMWNKAPAMVAAMQRRGITPPPLEPAEAADIFAYLIAVRYTAAGEPRKGRAVAAAKGCLGCHDVRGEGPGKAVNLASTRSVATPAGALAALWNHGFVGAAPGAPDRGLWATMTGDEMADLVAFLQSVAP